LAEFKWTIPVIPEKNNNKSGALLFDGSVFTSQIPADPGPGPGWPGPWPGNFITIRGSNPTNPDLAVPVTSGLYLHGQYYFTDKVSFNGFFDMGVNTGSRWAGTFAGEQVTTLPPSTGADATALAGGKMFSQYIANIVYDVNPAVRLVGEYLHSYESFYPVPPGTATLKNPPALNTVNTGWANQANINVYKIAVEYFF
jgi:hypothetical protein